MAVEVESMWQKAIELVNRVSGVTSGLDLPRGNWWLTVVTVGLSQANERLNSIRMLLDKGYWDSAEILTRSLFELAVNLTYISKDTGRRLPLYLQHGGIPLTNAEAQKLQQELGQGCSQDARDVVPGRVWKRLRGMCCDLGPQWLQEYETFYRYTSVPTHAGSFTLGKNYIRLLKQQPPSNREKAAVLIPALAFYLRVADTAACVFPRQIKFETVEKMSAECQRLGQSLAKRPH